jgi:hypothetical protein
MPSHHYAQNEAFLEQMSYVFPIGRVPVDKQHFAFCRLGSKEISGLQWRLDPR